MKIKDVEKQVGISKANIRFYEEEGLIHPARNLSYKVALSPATLPGVFRNRCRTASGN